MLLCGVCRPFLRRFAEWGAVGAVPLKCLIAAKKASIVCGMKIKFVLITFAAMSLTFIASVAACFVGYKLFAPRIYSADVQQIKKQYYKTAEASKRIKDMISGASAQLAQMNKQLNELQKRIKERNDSLKMALTDTERYRINNTEILPMVKELSAQRELAKKFSAEVRQRVTRLAKEENQKLSKEVNEEIARYAVGRLACYVLDSGSNPFCIPTRDISAEIIRRLNAKKAPDGGAPKPPEAPKPSVPGAPKPPDAGAPKPPAPEALKLAAPDAQKPAESAEDAEEESMLDTDFELP